MRQSRGREKRERARGRKKSLGVGWGGLKGEEEGAVQATAVPTPLSPQLPPRSLWPEAETWSLSKVKEERKKAGHIQRANPSQM